MVTELLLEATKMTPVGMLEEVPPRRYGDASLCAQPPTGHPQEAALFLLTQHESSSPFNRDSGEIPKSWRQRSHACMREQPYSWEELRVALIACGSSTATPSNTPPALHVASRCSFQRWHSAFREQASIRNGRKAS